jgi:trigger factor
MEVDVDVEELDTLKRKLNIKVPEAIISRKINQAYNELNHQIKMDGFRPGKIPRAILEKQVPVQSFTKMLQELMQEYYDQALMQTGLVPAGPPEIDHSGIEEIKADAPFSFAVTLDIKPAIKLIDYKGLKFEKKERKVTESDIQAVLAKYLEPYGKYEFYPDDHKIEVGNHLVMDFEGTLDGSPLENGTATDYPVKVGEKRMIEGFEDQLVGKKAGEEFEVKVALPADWNNKLRRVSMPIPGAENEVPDDVATFNVKVKEIKKFILPELTDEFVQELGDESVDVFLRKVKGDIESFREHQEGIRIKEEIFNKLVKEHDIVPSESLVKMETQFMVEGMKFRIQQSGTTLEDSGFDEAKAEEEWREKAEFNTKGYQILDSIAAQEKITVNQSDLQKEYDRLAEETKMPADRVKEKLIANPDYLNSTTTRLRGQKALNFIYSHCEFDYVTDDPTEEKKEDGSESDTAKSSK